MTELTDELAPFVQEFQNESDRAVVLLGAARLDSLLYELFAQVLRPNAASRDELLDAEGGLAPFGARINLCYRLGLIDSVFSRALHLVRKLAVELTRASEECSLASAPYRDKVKELIQPLARHPAFGTLRQDYFEAAGESAEFRTALALMVARLRRVLGLVKPLSGQYAVALVPRRWLRHPSAGTHSSTLDADTQLANV